MAAGYCSSAVKAPVSSQQANEWMRFETKTKPHGGVIQQLRVDDIAGLDAHYSCNISQGKDEDADGYK